MKRISIYDSTLRDGAQAQGISYSVEDKVRIVEKLDALGVHYIEVGNPGSNPKDLEFFERVVALAKRHDILVVHDLAYADIVFDGWRAPSIMQVPGARDVAVEFFTMSKSYNMAGWRIGFMVGNKDLVNALARIKSYHDYGTFTPLQVAAIAALEGPQDCV